ncbi:uncharacterized protein METZ01_LOCUS471703 [marine metagenome]|jgi:hypothetical protein|uniref:Uncharacterized protein n=1 Tax=marine metagenome TaxID=408172 RepID=A0A383BG54_9ZZZZ|tara:strand:+ start:470 stop:703 length:234 start_codon:yes stop_codon:yes gene_type:complete
MKKFDKFKAHGLIIEDIKAQVSIEEDDSVTIKFVGFKSNPSAQEYANRILANMGFILEMIEENAPNDSLTNEKKTIH